MKLSVNKLNHEQRTLDDLWATGIKARANWVCAICGDDNRVAAHHIIPRECKEFRYCADNGIVLCVSHHKFSRIISAHCNPLAFFMWLARYRPELLEKAEQRTREMLKANGIQV